MQVPTSSRNQTTLSQAKDPNLEVKESKTVKTLIYAEGPNSVFIRVQNMEDHFDKDPKTFNLDVNAFARELFSEANPQLSEIQLNMLKINISEKTLTGVTNYEEREKEFIKWKTNEP